ncbi:MAG: glycoside hydrolase/deacetylase [Frankiales bacterium]|nr:glycoside hydrolase/deacetylase [Frankiales bacterium]
MKRWLVLIALVMAGLVVGWAIGSYPYNGPSVRHGQVQVSIEKPLPSAAPLLVAPPVPMVVWHGPVEHLFFHPLVLDPRKAFTNDLLGKGFADYFVTAREFHDIVDSLWDRGWTLVDAHRVMNGTVRVPAGRKPLVLSEDDVNYYRYFDGRGLAKRLVLDGARVRAELPDGSLSDEDLVPIVDAEVAAHPLFSADGARGVLAVTGYEGLLGEHGVATDSAARARTRALADRLRATGWSFASHTYGHIDLTHDSVRRISADTAKWRVLVGDLLGPVDLLVYPFGSRPSVAGAAYLRQAGFPYQFDIDIRPALLRRGGALVMSRRHVDGLAFGVPGRLAPFFDVTAVRDPLRPG